MRSGTRSDLRTDSRSRCVAQRILLRAARGSYGSDLVIPVEHKCHHQFRTVCTIFSRAIKEFADEKSYFRFALLRSYNTLFNGVCVTRRVTCVERVLSTCFANSMSNVSKRHFAALSICIAERVCSVLRLPTVLPRVVRALLRVCFNSASEVKLDVMSSDACGRLS
jgi:hypothetical protein